MSASLVWQVIWPWLFYEILLEVLSFLFAGAIGDMGVLLLSMTVASAVLYPVYFSRERREEAQKKSNCGWFRSMFWCVTWTAVSACLCFNLLLFLTGIGSRSGAYAETAGVLFSLPWRMQLLVMGLAAPLCEEVIFRGLVYRCLKREKGSAVAAVVSALLFALFHGNLLQGIYAGGLGLLLSLACECGFGAALWFHSCINVSAIGFNFLLDAGMPLILSRGLCFLLLAVSGIGTALGVFGMRKFIRERDTKKEKPEI